MNYTEHKFTLDVSKTASQVSLSVKKGDTARKLLISLMKRGYPYHITRDCYAVLAATKPDGHVIFNNCTIENCVIGYDFTPQTVSAVGLMSCEVIVYGKRGVQLTSASFDIIVEDSNYSALESSSEATALSTLMQEVKALYALGLRAPAIVGDVEGETISIRDASDEALQGLRIFGKSTQEVTPTLDNPVEIVNVGAGGSIEAKIMGKNIASDVVYASFSTDYASLLMCNDTGAVEKGKIYTISVTLTADKETKAYWNSLSKFFANETIIVLAGTNRYSKTFTALEDGISGKERILLSKSATSDGVAIKSSDCQIERGSAATEYVHAEQSMVISTPDGLPGLRVTSDGNYTDADGQEWICDEVDLARGVYVQRIDKINLATITSWVRGTGNGWANVSAFHAASAVPKAVPVEGYETKANLLCNRLPIGIPGRIAGQIVNHVGQGMGASIYVSIEGIETAEDLIAYLDENETIVQYALATPIETALTAEEIAAFAQLQTYKPNTTIFNDAGAYMEAAYVADTKTYVVRNGGGSAAIISEATLLADAWVGDESPYSQVVAIASVTEYSQVDLTPSVEQLAIFHDKDLAFVTENDGGVVTVYAIGDKPTNDYTMQVTITEVYV